MNPPPMFVSLGVVRADGRRETVEIYDSEELALEVSAYMNAENKLQGARDGNG